MRTMRSIVHIVVIVMSSPAYRSLNRYIRTNSRILTGFSSAVKKNSWIGLTSLRGIFENTIDEALMVFAAGTSNVMSLHGLMHEFDE
jgi:hypothetical protein